LAFILAITLISVGWLTLLLKFGVLIETPLLKPSLKKAKYTNTLTKKEDIARPSSTLGGQNALRNKYSQLSLYALLNI